MKICPKCGTQYTDKTLKFCLQDGVELGNPPEDKTEVFDADEFAQRATVAISGGETDPRADSRSTKNENSTSPESVATVERNLADHQTQRRSSGFVFGFGAAVLIIGVFAAIVVGLWVYPKITGDRPIANTNADTASEIEPVSRDSITSIESSSIRKQEKGNLYIPENLSDNDDRTAWAEGVRGTGKDEWVQFNFDKPLTVKELRIKPGYFKNASLWKKNNRVASVELRFSGGESRKFDFPDEMRNQKVSFSVGKTSFVKIYIRDIYRGSADAEDTLISEMSFAALSE